ncbi:MAG: heme o synthase [Sulfobacillus sp.]|nr:heme o synthase [Sulfobacillus sp.]
MVEHARVISPPKASVKDYIQLMKPGIVVWLMITAFSAMVVAAHGIPPISTMVWTLMGLGLSAGGAHAVNMWYDRDIDRIMKRTQNRPVVTGKISPEQALAFGIAAGLVSFIGLGVLVNWLTASATLAGYLFYIFVYTMWLKRRSAQNIVIGGAAGAFPPIVGWTAVTHQLGWAPWLMFLLIFLWTPPHFWSLALYKQDDYRRAEIPMMPIVRGPRVTKAQNVVYAVLTVLASVGLYFTHTVSLIYLVSAIVLGVVFVGYTVRLWLEPDSETVWAKKTFFFSLMYIAGLFVVMMI